MDSCVDIGSQSLDKSAHGVSDIPVAAVDQTNVLRRRRVPEVHDLDVRIVKILQ